MRSAACVWLLCVTLLSMQGCAENQFAPSYARGNTGLTEWFKSALYHPDNDNDNFPLGETDVTDDDLYDLYDPYVYELNSEQSPEDLIRQIQEEMEWANGDPRRLAQIRHAIVRARKALKRRAQAEKNLATAAPNEMGKVSEETGDLSKEQLKASVSEQRDHDVRKPSVAFVNRREDSESPNVPEDVQRQSGGVIVAPQLWESAKTEKNNQGAMFDQARDYEYYDGMDNDEIVQAKLMMRLMQNPIWAEWTRWSRCQGQCGTGYRTRTRACRVRGLCEEQTVAEACPLKNECENARGYVAGIIVVSVLAALLVAMLAVLLLMPKIQKYRFSRLERKRDANLKKRSSMPDRPPPIAPRPDSTLPERSLPNLPSAEHVYLTLSEVKVGGKTYLAPAGTSAEDIVHLTPSQINQPNMDANPKSEENPENEEEVEEGNKDEENAYLELSGAN
ncbi:uncharacterized protein LOC144879183 [Branchiostoma floridae x Branchiostoma japonicum]